MPALESVSGHALPYPPGLTLRGYKSIDAHQQIIDHGSGLEHLTGLAAGIWGPFPGNWSVETKPAVLP